MLTYVSDILQKKKVGEEARQGMKVSEIGGEVGEQGRCIYLMITFLLVAALETPRTRSSQQTKIISKQKKRWRRPGIKVDREQKHGEL